MRSILIAAALFVSPPLPTQAASSAPPAPPLPAHLSSLYHAYPQLHKTLSQYANNQGFTGPKEHLSTILHELIHIDSAAKGAYVIHGHTYAPYNQPDAWPAYRFAQFREALSQNIYPDSQRLTATAVYRLYISNIPNNTLASLADELNAYGQTATWLCQATPSDRHERVKTLDSMRDMLYITNAYLSVLRKVTPAQYSAFYVYQKPARNLLALTLVNALDALRICGMQLNSADSDEIGRLIVRAKTEALPP